mmetsp:Transcript_30779/g.89383  ORF Transcript_30779/g.89383 Transcript_30779/m.89383 type:complete len:222 (-) Transcript_30779:9-674(-)
MSSSTGISWSLHRWNKHEGCSIRMARPKSISLMCQVPVLDGFDDSKMFSAFTSRCTTLCACKCRSAANNCRPMVATQSSVTVTDGSPKAVKSSPPVTNSRTRNNHRSFSNTSTRSTMWACLTAFKMLASWRAEIKELACLKTSLFVSTIFTAYFPPSSNSWTGQQSLTSVNPARCHAASPVQPTYGLPQLAIDGVALPIPCRAAPLRAACEQQGDFGNKAA